MKSRLPAQAYTEAFALKLKIRQTVRRNQLDEVTQFIHVERGLRAARLIRVVAATPAITLSSSRLRLFRALPLFVNGCLCRCCLIGHSLFSSEQMMCRVRPVLFASGKVKSPNRCGSDAPTVIGARGWRAACFDHMGWRVARLTGFLAVTSPCPSQQPLILFSERDHPAWAYSPLAPRRFALHPDHAPL